MSSARAEHELSHGRWLAEHDPELVWGWGTPAGLRRAKRRAELIARQAKLAPEVTALEVGCGGGLFTELFAATGATVLAVEISPELVELARARGLPSERVRVLCGRFEDVPIPQERGTGQRADRFAAPFDAVIGSSVLHHLDLEAALRRMLGLLRPGGTLAFAEPNLINPQVWMERRFRHWERFRYVSPDETAFVRWRLADVMESMGFVDVRITPFDWLHPATPGAIVGAVECCGRALESIPLLREAAGSLLIRGRRPLSPPRSQRDTWGQEREDRSR
jgi:SAM-dependent methyltransferase